jgi:hypothetical protein
MQNVKIRNCMGPCNLIGEHRGFGFDLLPQSSDGLWWYTENAPPKHAYSCTRLYNVHTQTTLLIFTIVSTSNPVPRNYKNWSVDGNVKLWKQNDTRAVCSWQTQYLTSCNFSTKCVHSDSFFVPHKIWKWTIIGVKTHFALRTTYDEFQSSTNIIS